MSKLVLNVKYLLLLSFLTAAKFYNLEHIHGIISKPNLYPYLPDPKWWGRVLLFLMYDRYLNQKIAISANLSESLILLSPNLSFLNDK